MMIAVAVVALVTWCVRLDPPVPVIVLVAGPILGAVIDRRLGRRGIRGGAIGGLVVFVVLLFTGSIIAVDREEVLLFTRSIIAVDWDEAVPLTIAKILCPLLGATGAAACFGCWIGSLVWAVAKLLPPKAQGSPLNETVPPSD